ncbi:unnamed protein product [Acanthoscelides obtectus]|uniref:Uncharacterized protein n=1 Tax=Acanthoscelides obtectus TaxID=200917 RepID=A0A9P0LPA3_ACAOB|nr:unnamed protein product [Acanthoscelides obtectus]CAK1646274.1 Phosphatidylglycerophosphatase and protein-tyrosine phosphatase 1 [Acanthoscelides obtectus]
MNEDYELMFANDARRYNWTPEEAVRHMKEKRPHILMHKKQLEALQIFYQHNLGNFSDEYPS